MRNIQDELYFSEEFFPEDFGTGPRCVAERPGMLLAEKHVFVP